jgi:hypothetical protein
MTKRFSVIFKSALVISFACSTIPAFAQHGGGGMGGGGGSHGGGGGGFHGGGGGGFHGGGSGGGGFHGGAVGGGFRGGASLPRAAGAGAPSFVAPHPVAPSPMRSGGGFVSRPGNNYSPAGGNYAGRNQRGGNSSSAPPAVTDGRWHSFGGPTGGSRAAGAQSESGPRSNGGWQVASGNRGGGSTGAVRSFSGQGNQVWENSAAARNVIPRSQSLSRIHNSLNGSLTASSSSRSTAPLSGSSHFARGSASVGNRHFIGGVNTASTPLQHQGFNRVGYRYYGENRGCWNCGFGFGGGRGWGWGNRWGWGGGWGFGWGWPGFGFWGWDPFWFDPWWGWPSAGYGYYGPVNNYNIYNSPDSGNYGPNDNSSPPPQEEDQYDQGNSNGNWVTPNGPSPSNAPNSANLTVPVLIYMKNGAVYSVRDYWMTDDEFYYVLGDGSQHSIALDQVDLPRTNTENTKSGVKFIIKSDPSITAPAPDGSAAPPVQPNSDKPSAIRQPDART